MDMWVWVVIVVAVVLIVGAAIAAYAMQQQQKRRTERLQSDFGPEYDRALNESGSRRDAEKALLGRKERVEKFKLRALSPSERSRFSSEWQSTQSRFVDAPNEAIRDADRLVGEAMKARGFPTGDYDQRFADVSVEHPYVVEHYRAAYDVARKNEAGEADTEDMRQAMVHYRELFNELLNAQESGRVYEDDQPRRSGGGEPHPAS